MSELGNLFRDIRGPLSRGEMAKKFSISKATIQKIEDGSTDSETLIKLPTLRKLAKACKLPRAKYLELVRAWIMLKLGDDAMYFDVEPKNIEMKDSEPSVALQLSTLSQNWPHKEQKAILAVVKDPNLRRAVVALANYGS